MPDQTSTDASDRQTKAPISTRLKEMLRPSLTDLKEFVRHPSRITGKDSAHRPNIQAPSVAGQSTNASRLTEMPAKPETHDPWGRSRGSQHSLAHVGPEDDRSNADGKPPDRTLPNPDPDEITPLPPKLSYPTQSQGQGN